MQVEIINKTGARLNIWGILYYEILCVTNITRPCNMQYYGVYITVTTPLHEAQQQW